MKNLVCYILVRHLPHTLNPGKMAAQVHHAGVKMRTEFAKHPDLKDYTKQHEAHSGFGTTIVLQPNNDKASSGKRIKGITRKARKLGLAAGNIIDPTYPVDFELTVAALTCGYVLVDKNNKKYEKLLRIIQNHWELQK